MADICHSCLIFVWNNCKNNYLKIFVKNVLNFFWIWCNHQMSVTLIIELSKHEPRNARIWTQDLPISNPPLYHWAHSPCIWNCKEIQIIEVGLKRCLLVRRDYLKKFDKTRILLKWLKWLKMWKFFIIIIFACYFVFESKIWFTTNTKNNGFGCLFGLSLLLLLLITL